MTDGLCFSIGFNPSKVQSDFSTWLTLARRLIIRRYSLFLHENISFLVCSLCKWLVPLTLHRVYAEISDHEINDFIVKPWPKSLKDHNISTQHIATLLSATYWSRLATLLRRVATCWVLLAQFWKSHATSVKDTWCHIRLARFVQQRHTRACGFSGFGISITSKNVFKPQKIIAQWSWLRNEILVMNDVTSGTSQSFMFLQFGLLEDRPHCFTNLMLQFCLFFVNKDA